MERVLHVFPASVHLPGEVNAEKDMRVRITATTMTIWREVDRRPVVVYDGPSTLEEPLPASLVWGQALHLGDYTVRRGLGCGCGSVLASVPLD